MWLKLKKGDILIKDETSHSWLGWAAIIAVIGGGLYWMNSAGLKRNVSVCLESNNRYTGDFHHIYLTDVVSAERIRTYPDGTAMRSVQYLVEGSEQQQSTTCRW
mgnify:CR=1 FL=1|tara:strand:- start:227 stop:538 length:312 start_codon:yes stop_codon:yes gene_type:complete